MEIKMSIFFFFDKSDRSRYNPGIRTIKKVGQENISE